MIKKYKERGCITRKSADGLKLIFKFILKVFPLVDKQLDQWTHRISEAGDDVLKKQGLLSIANKKFHAQGGSIYSLYPGVLFDNTIGFIVAFQTISDYLDNLCDRAGVLDEVAFRTLHEAMLDAVDPSTDTHDYYFYYPYKDDNGYLRNLVEECKCRIRNLPSYKVVAEPVKKYVQYYSCLQIYKHLSPHIRESILKQWADSQLKNYPIYWWELSAAAGSTLGVFILLSAAYDSHLTTIEVNSIEEAYFPWVCGLHILLDYYIDSDEDRMTGDLNFIDYYENARQCEERFIFFIKNSFSKCAALRYPDFHHTVIRGLIAMYLSDPKATVGLKRLSYRKLINAGGRRTTTYYRICRFLRGAGII